MPRIVGTKSFARKLFFDLQLFGLLSAISSGVVATLGIVCVRAADQESRPIGRGVSCRHFKHPDVVLAVVLKKTIQFCWEIKINDFGNCSCMYLCYRPKWPLWETAGVRYYRCERRPLRETPVSYMRIIGMHNWCERLLYRKHENPWLSYRLRGTTELRFVNKETMKNATKNTRIRSHFSYIVFWFVTIFIAPVSF